jgi:hypothetical protein
MVVVSITAIVTLAKMGRFKPAIRQRLLAGQHHAGLAPVQSSDHAGDLHHLRPNLPSED